MYEAPWSGPEVELYFYNRHIKDTFLGECRSAVHSVSGLWGCLFLSSVGMRKSAAVCHPCSLASELLPGILLRDLNFWQREVQDLFQFHSSPCCQLLVMMSPRVLPVLVAVLQWMALLIVLLSVWSFRKACIHFPLCSPGCGVFCCLFISVQFLLFSSC